MLEATFITTKQAAEILHCCESTVGQLRRKGFIRGTRFGRRFIYNQEEIEDFLMDNQGKDFHGFNDLSENEIKRRFNV